METLCSIRDLYRSIAEFETRFEKIHNLSLNEGMLLCSLTKADRLSSGEIAELLGLTTSNTSKVIKSVENKELIERGLGSRDKRQMYFSLTDKGRSRFREIKSQNIEIPPMLERAIKE